LYVFPARKAWMEEERDEERKSAKISVVGIQKGP
jgi:hypothetical protein